MLTLVCDVRLPNEHICPKFAGEPNNDLLCNGSLEKEEDPLDGSLYSQSFLEEEVQGHLP